MGVEDVLSCAERAFRVDVRGRGVAVGGGDGFWVSFSSMEVTLRRRALACLAESSWDSWASSAARVRSFLDDRATALRAFRTASSARSRAFFAAFVELFFSFFAVFFLSVLVCATVRTSGCERADPGLDTHDRRAHTGAGEQVSAGVAIGQRRAPGVQGMGICPSGVG
ncbi:hypothetical protein D8M34_08220 [Microbacterium sp. HSID17254]|nr:hypothetical protein D8M34_08220 [Microbacterium sp. HSID17254]